jgi:hypothetical protein
MIQCIVKPQESMSSVQGRCHIELSDEDRASLGNDNLQPVEIVPVPETSNKQSTMVDDSDDEEDAVPLPTPVPVVLPTPVPVVLPTPVPVVLPTPVVVVPVVSSTDEAPKKKMVVKKKVVA